jgi:hypothetical protein
MDKRINIGAFSRLVIKQILGGEKGQGVIDAIEQGLGSAIGALAVPGTDLLNVAVGFSLPLLLAVINQPRWPSWFKALVMAASCLLIALARMAMDGLSAAFTLRSALLLIIYTGTAYNTFWKPLGIKGLEFKTVMPSLDGLFDQGNPFGEVVRPGVEVREGLPPLGVDHGPAYLPDYSAPNNAPVPMAPPMAPPAMPTLHPEETYDGPTG